MEPAALTNPPANIEKEAIWIRGAMGRLRMLSAMYPAMKKENRVKISPMAISKIMPVMNMLLISVARFSALYWAV